MAQRIAYVTGGMGVSEPQSVSVYQRVDLR